MPVLEQASGLKWKSDFNVGYSPERINPGDKERRFDNILKIVSGDTPETLDIIDSVYKSVVTAGTHRAESIRVAEFAKVLENTQRDVNIALINEVALICDRLGVDTQDVLNVRFQIGLGRSQMTALPQSGQGRRDYLVPRGPHSLRQLGHVDLRAAVRRRKVPTRSLNNAQMGSALFVRPAYRAHVASPNGRRAPHCSEAIADRAGFHTAATHDADGDA